MPRLAVTELLKVTSLRAGYGEINVLWDADFTIRKGEITALIGSNGAGKSTLMRTLSGLIVPTQGEILFNGVSVGGKTPAQILAHGVAHVPEGRRLFGAMSVEENLFMGAYLRTKLSRAELARDLDRVYQIFPKLFERRRQAASTMSGGEQQMCAIGRGLMSAPILLMIDELSLGLAPVLIEQLIVSLINLNKEGLSIFVVEQDVVTALEVSQASLVMDQGLIIRQGESKDLLADPSIRAAYLGELV
ncbi:MAG: ABC transporter ATP-binding protein [Burkholderiales bacterium]|nr:ABC transporter ATP-binding protein [Burkholderiales bacterium]